MKSMFPLLRLVLALFASALLGACSDPATTLVPRPPGGDFVLQAIEGPLDTRSLRGKVLLIYFGYVNCPDVCPVSIAAGAGALNALSPDERERTRMIMVSVDPERDTPAAMKEYVAYFGPTFRGLTGSPDEIAAVLAAYGVYARKVKLEGSALDYTVDHSSFIYLFGPDGAFLTVLDPQQDSAALAAKLKETVK